jgi:O-antigen ligase
LGSLHQPQHRPFTPADEGGEERQSVLMAVSETSLLAIILGCVAVSYAFPFPIVKYGVAAFFCGLLALQTIRRPALGLAMLAFATPAMGLIPPDIVPIPGVNAETGLILVLLLIWARASQVHGADTVRSPISRALLAYAVLIVASSLHSTLLWSTSAAGILAAAKNHLSLMLFFPATLHVVRDERDRWVMFITCTIVVFLNAMQAIDNSWYAFFTGSLERYRAGALISPQPNIFGAFLVLYLPVLIAVGARRVSKLGFSLWCLLVAGAASFALLLTLSRASWIGFAAALAVMALLWDRRLLVVFVLLAMTHTYWMPQDAIERVEETTASQSFDYNVSDQVADDSTQMRIEQYKSLPSMMAPKPIFGWGYHSFPRVFERHGTLGRAKGAHSTYCLIATEEGIVGLAVFGTLLVLVFRTCLQAARFVDDRLAKWSAAGLACATIGVVVAMAGGERFEAQIVWVYFWIMLALVERQLRLAQAGHEAAAEAAAKS